MAITLRNTKGSALTYEELDGNFTDLNGRVLDSDGIRALVDSDYVQARQNDIRDSAFVTSIVDSDFGTRTTTNLTEGTNLYYTTARHDSDFAVKLDSSTTDNLSEGTTNLYYTTARGDSDTQALVDSAYVQARMTAHYSGFDSDFGTKTTTDLTEGTNLYFTSARFDSDLGTKTTTNIAEGTNLYYTTTRFDSDLGTKTTTNLAEGNNLYYTTARHDSDFTTSLNAATLAYATDSAALWSGSAPTTVDSALDRLALVVRTLNGGTGA